MAEPKSPVPSAPKKRNIYSTTDANAIGQMDPIDIDFNPPQTLGKRKRLVISGPSRVPADGAAPPPKPQCFSRPTRKTTRVTKAASTKNTTSDLFARLGQEFHAIARTCEGLAEALEGSGQTLHVSTIYCHTDTIFNTYNILPN